MWQRAYQCAANAVLNKNITLYFDIAEEVEKGSLDLQLRKYISAN
ncbi:MAG: hypothetical protein JWQ14_63 [Adhaeribacter sp.]|nr:hypothetical protein [Adhaeribacter sp.]